MALPLKLVNEDAVRACEIAAFLGTVHLCTGTIETFFFRPESVPRFHQDPSANTISLHVL
jgi:hypothetical protein